MGLDDNNSHEIYTYIGLTTSKIPPKLETSGLGDRILRWHLVATWASLYNKQVIIPIIYNKKSKIVHETIWTSSSLNTYFKFPSFITLTDNPITTLIPTTPSFYIQEPRMFFSAFRYWESIPQKFKHIGDESLFNNTISRTKIEPRIGNVIKEPYIVLHIRQMDVAFQVKPILTKLISDLIDLRIYIISDASSEYIKQVEELLTSSGITILNKIDTDHHRDTNTVDDPNTTDVLLRQLAYDYAIMWYSHGIISLTKRQYSAFPYCVAKQQNIPVLFYPKSRFSGPHITKSISEFIRIITSKLASL